MRYFKLVLAVALLTLCVTLSFAGLRDRSSLIELVPDPDNYISMPEVATAPSTPITGWAKVYSLANDIYFIDDAGTATSMIGAAAGGVYSLDESYDDGGAGAGATINADSGPVIFAGSGTDYALQGTHSGTGNVIDIINAGTGKDIDGTSSTWSVTKGGIADFVSIGDHIITGDTDFDDGVTDSPSLTFTDATNETAVFSKANTGVLSVTTDASDGFNVLVGNLLVGNGAAGTAAMDGEDAYIEGELEVDGACEFDGAVNIDGAVDIDEVVTLTNGLTIDNEVNNSFEWNENSEEITWVFGADSLDLDSTSGVVLFGLFDGSAGAINHTTDGAADDFTLSVTGATDSSLIVSSTGTGADALQVTTTAGGILLDADGAANGDIEINAADDIAITAAGLVNISGSLVHAGIQDIPAGGTTTAVVMTNQVITVGSDAGGDIVTMVNGTAGQIMYFICEDESGVTTITPETMNGGASITFDALGDAVTLIYTTGTGWSIVGGNSYTII